MNQKPFLITDCYPKLKGYSNRPRQDYILVRLGLDENTLYFYSLLRDLMTDWDTRHTKIGHFVFDPRNIEFYTGWPEATIYRRWKRLRDLGMVKVVDKRSSLYALVGYDLMLSMYQKTSASHLNSDYGYLYSLLNLFAENAVLTTEVLLMQNRLISMQAELSDLRSKYQVKSVAKASAPTKYNPYLVASNGECNGSEISEEDRRDILESLTCARGYNAKDESV